MKILYFDCSSGVSGDMILGAFLDLGLNLNFLKKQINNLGLKGIELRAKKVRRGELFGTQLEIIYNKQKTSNEFRTLPEVVKLIEKSKLSKVVKNLGKKIFINLARAESKVHGERIEHIHFHELSHADTLIDIIGAVSAICEQKIDKIYTSPLPLSYGTVKSQAGPLPVPAPAVVNLIKDYPVYFVPIKQELLTPTGVSIITTLAEKNLPKGNYKILKTGFGAGSHIIKELPNLLRLIIAERELGKIKKRLT